jgi:hypothetical protein
MELSVAPSITNYDNKLSLTASDTHAKTFEAQLKSVLNMAWDKS